MSNRVFIDTLFVVALINPRDQHHAKATELAARFENRSFLVSDAVLLEVGNGLARNYKQDAIAVIEGFFDSEEVQIIHISPELFGRAFELYKKHKDKDWGLIDCTSFVIMRDASVTQALTFDQHFEQAGFKALMAQDDN